ncbi:DNA-binding transcriptional response regulator, NtrC family, contains REC, AAA-type ATPase, and a Fis-type DNA-binding domains [Methylomagnum ishizawai]|uniref:DNA-binding transcriptional response regulator, NtrC family, contains REC, AAA-type ATPase, and a Fis-type DNA-binding domains n=1 Tax=Methylomagnum ishizawai TaxID=1760988 RepID=A0A1Y6CZZ1_9GAMM|nr:sigma-54 dependent transcriptional regulator [Methylomagnum ishizawai]SMF94143.1 DNA-binding transcriptional response regulator, NtrC family, contains REC, AAA-type ATPase, and a Fis-type DNA-binding domains [Methylomagnum ishizawai]
MSKTSILVVDDEPDIRRLLQEILEDEGYAVHVAENGAVARELRSAHKPDLILLDIWMPDEDGISLLKDWLRDETLGPVIMMSGHATVETAVEATRLGAYDFLEKPLSMAKLLVTVERALENAQLKRENVGLRRRVEAPVEPVGRGAAMERLRDQVRRLAQHDARVLFVGEPGCGKETLARYLHANSVRRDGPFIDVGVGTIAPEYSAVEFFGRADGAGNVQRGLLEQAHGGTLFLDEVADMEEETQVRLMSALESNSFSRVGGSELVHVDVRIVASTRKSLEEEVRAGRFRRELYYLLNVVTLRVPPLAEHNEDVPELLGFYVDYFVSREKLPFRRFGVAVQNFLRHYPWHGNVRELKNLVQRLLILGSGEEVELDEAKAALGESLSVPGIALNQPDFYDLPLKDAREHFEKAYLEYHLEKYAGSVARLSQAIGLERTHLYRKLNSLGIKFKDKR